MASVALFVSRYLLFPLKLELIEAYKEASEVPRFNYSKLNQLFCCSAPAGPLIQTSNFKDNK